jgi:glycosyltransferase involved in cell wall biosynthesis
MKILVIAAGPLPFARGTPARTLRVSQALEARGHEVCVAAFSIADEEIETELRIVRCRALRGYEKTTPGPSVTKLLVMNPRLAATACELLRNEPFDVIYAHHYEGLLVASIARRRAGLSLPIVFDSHTLLGAELRFYFPKRLSHPINWLGVALDRCLSRLADAIVSVTDEITQFYASRALLSTPVLTAPNGVEYEKFDHAPQPEDSQKPVRVVFAGNLSEYQGFELLISAFGRARLQRPHLQLLVAAHDAANVLAALDIDKPEAEGIAIRDGSFGALPDILACADIAANPRVVCPGIPQKLLNYMAAALPTVSFEGSATILRHEETGLIVENGDVEAFAGAIVRLADSYDLRRRLGIAARALIEAEYDWERVAVTFERAVALLERERLLGRR